MHVRQKRNRSGSVSVVVDDKAGGRYREVHTVGIDREKSGIEQLVKEGREWIRLHKLERQPELDLHGEERRVLESEREMTERLISNIDSILLNGTELILDRVFDRIGFNRIEDEVFRKLGGALTKSGDY